MLGLLNSTLGHRRVADVGVGLMEIAPSGPLKGTKDVWVLRSTSSPNNHNDIAIPKRTMQKGNKKSRSMVGGGTKWLVKNLY